MPSRGDQPSGGLGVLKCSLKVRLADGSMIRFQLVLMGLGECHIIEIPQRALELETRSEFANVVCRNQGGRP